MFGFFECEGGLGSQAENATRSLRGRPARRRIRLEANNVPTRLDMLGIGNNRFMARTTPNEDRMDGAVDKAKGRVKDAGGAVTGDRSLQAEGRGDQAKGTFKQKKGLLRKLFR